MVATVNLASVDTGDAGRDAHLLNADFFDLEGGGSPTMTFVSTGIKDDDGDYVLFGDLTINGVTRQVEFDLEFEGVNVDPWNNTKAGFSADDRDQPQGLRPRVERRARDRWCTGERQGEGAARHPGRQGLSRDTNRQRGGCDEDDRARTRGALRP